MDDGRQKSVRDHSAKKWFNNSFKYGISNGFWEQVEFQTVKKSVYKSDVKTGWINKLSKAEVVKTIKKYGIVKVDET